MNQVVCLDGSSKLVTACHRNFNELPNDVVRQLNEASLCHVESTVSWFKNLQATVFPEDPTVRHYITSRDGQLLALMPLRLEQSGTIRQIESLANYYTSLYEPLLNSLTPASAIAQILSSAISEFKGANVVRIAPLSQASPSIDSVVSSLQKLGWVPFKFYCFGNWYLDVQCNWKCYLDQREGILKNTIKRKAKKFNDAGGTFEIVQSPEFVEKSIAEYNAVYAKSWKCAEPYSDFVPGLIRWLATDGLLRLGIARISDTPIAAQIWIVHNKKASIFKLAYDENYTEFGAGTLLTATLMEHVIDRDKVTQVDFMIGDDEHKKLWMSDRRERWGVIAYNPKSITGLALLIRESVSRFLKKAAHLAKKGDSQK